MRERDQEVEDFIRACPRSMTYSEIEQGILERFGTDRIWSRTRVFEFWKGVNGANKGRPWKIDVDPEVLHFIEDRLGRMTYENITAECRRLFGARAPSRSTIHRYHQKVRKTGPYKDKARSRKTP